MSKINKIILQSLNNKGEINNEKEYRSLLALHKDNSNIEYYQWREIYMNNKKTKPRKLQSVNLFLSQNYRVIDNPEFLNKFTIKQNDESEQLATVA